jgi:Transglycosylase SLT domain
MSIRQEKTMRRLISIVSLVAIGSGLVMSAPAAAKKKKPEPTLFDECPVSETIRVASDASIDGLDSLAACDDVEVAPADAEDLPMLPKMRAAESDGEDEFEVETAELPLRARGSAPYPVKVTNADAVRKGDKKSRGKNGYGGTYEVRSTITGTPFLSFKPEQAEEDLSATQVSYSSASFGAMPSADLTGAAPSGKSVSGDAILDMRPVRYKTGYDDLIGQVAQRHRIDPLLLHAVIKQESGYRPAARSHVGAQGLMQIMPGTGAMLGVRREHLNDPHTNVDAGARLLRKLAIKYDGNFDLVLAAYNAGEGAVQKYGNRIPPYRETQDYVRKVMGNYYQLLNDNTGGAQR